MSEDAIAKLIQDVKDALADGKVNVFEIMRIVGDLVAVVNQFIKGKSIA